MTTRGKNNVHVIGQTGIAARTMLFAHGYGCDQNMWRYLVPHFQDSFRIVLVDLVGCGKSDLTAYDRNKYASLRGHALDVLDILAEFSSAPSIFVGHSCSAMIGLLACNERPDRFSEQIMIGPSPCYLNDGDYRGGFERRDIDQLIETLDANYLGWARHMAPVIMGAPDRPALAEELTNSFCATDPEIAKHFARTVFLSDNRADLKRFDKRCLIVQCSEDIIAPVAVGQYLHWSLPNSALRIVDNVGHCPHLSAPREVAAAIEEFV